MIERLREAQGLGRRILVMHRKPAVSAEQLVNGEFGDNAGNHDTTIHFLASPQHLRKCLANK